MLHSKYLTQEGMEIMLKTLYKNGWRYIFQGQQRGKFYASVEKPHYHENEVFSYCDGNKSSFDSTANALIADTLSGYNYIEIADHIDIVDWSTVKVDTPVKVFYDNGNLQCRRHFADYRDGQVYVFQYGATSWSARVEPIPVKNVKLAKN